MDVEWLSKDEANNPIDDNPNEGGGKRYYPGKRLPTESNPRNLVTLKVSVPGLAGRQVKLKAFDVDDPTDQPVGYTDFDADVIDTNDDAGDDNFDDSLSTPKSGQFVLNSATSPTATVTLDDDGEAEIDFQVGMQPGNNYRVVAVIKDIEGNFDQLQVSDSSADTFVTADDELLSGFTGAGAASPILTVWRHLWCEFDSMESVENALATSEVNYEWGTIDTITTAGMPSGQSKVNVGQGLLDEENRYEGGFLSVFFDGADHEYEIVSNTDYLVSDDEVVIIGTPGSIVEGKSFSIYDDDYIINSSQVSPSTHVTLPYTLSGGGSNSFGGNLIEDAYAVAYITPKLAPAEYVDTDVTFNRNVNEPIEPFTLMGNIGKDLEDTENYWAVHLLASWQGDVDKDRDGGDPGGIVSNGLSADLFNSGFIYIETIREAEISPFWPKFLEEHVVVHEIGHQGGGDHDDEGIMGEPMDTSEVFESLQGGRFWPATVKKFREGLKF